MYKTNEDKFYVSKTEMEEKLIALLGGRAAEKLALDDISTGARNDIQVSTSIAKDMITVYGMNDRLGPISFEDETGEQFKIFGNNIEDVIGEEVRKMIDTAYINAQAILSKNMDKLHEIAGVLLQKETISAEEFENFFK